MYNKKSEKTKILSPDHIEGFIYGGFNSRFWLMKNYINMLAPEQITDSMLCWNMISIKIKGELKYCNLILTEEG